MKKVSLIIIVLVVLAAVTGFGYKYYKNQSRALKPPKLTSTTMPAMYKEALEKTDLWINYGRNDEKIPVLEKMLEKNPGDKEIQFNLALQCFYDGQNQRAIDMWEKLEKDPAFNSDPKFLKKDDKFQQSIVDSVEIWLAVAYLRLGEQLNCINMHNSQSCVFPIAGNGIHQIKQPVEEAIDRYLALIKKDPTDNLSIWLLNIACQANGSVPSQVPANLIIPQSRIPNEYDIKHFDDIAVDLGIENVGHAGGVCAEDFDNDGYIDIINSGVGAREQIKYFHNNADGTFSDWTKKSGLMGQWEGVDIDNADYNNDGWMDFAIPRGTWKGKAGMFPMSLLKNNGDGTFTDVTIEAGVLVFAPSQTVEWFDANNDGWLDMFFGAEAGVASHLFLNNQDGTFKDVTKESGLFFNGFIKSASFGDYNNDGLTDLYCSNFTANNFLFKNTGNDKNGIPHFTDVAEQAGVQLPWFSFISWWFDYNNDGWLDLYVSAYKPYSTINSCREFMGLPLDSTLCPRLYRNNGDGTFTNVDREMHVHYETFTMGCSVGDLDNDGWLDFYVSIGAPDFRGIFPNRMFRNNEGKFFQDCTVSGGFGQLQKGHAPAFCDFDYDGDQDIYVDFGGFFTGDVFQNSFFENPGHDNNFINIRLQGVKNNYSGVGAKVKMTFIDNGVKRTTYNVINKGASFGGNPYLLQAGVGKATIINEIEIIWPAFNQKQTFVNVPVNQFLLCKEGESKLTSRDVHTFKFQTMERRMAAGDTTKMDHHMKM